MEAGYVDHQTISASGPLDHGQAWSVSMTATMDAMGNLVLGTIFISFIITWWTELSVLYFLLLFLSCRITSPFTCNGFCMSSLGLKAIKHCFCSLLFFQRIPSICKLLYYIYIIVCIYVCMYVYLFVCLYVCMYVCVGPGVGVGVYFSKIFVVLVILFHE